MTSVLLLIVIPFFSLLWRAVRCLTDNHPSKASQFPSSPIHLQIVWLESRAVGHVDVPNGMMYNSFTQRQTQQLNERQWKEEKLLNRCLAWTLVTQPAMRIIFLRVVKRSLTATSLKKAHRENILRRRSLMVRRRDALRQILGEVSPLKP